MFELPFLDWYFDQPPLLRAGVGLLILAVCIVLVYVAVAPIWLLALGVLALAGAIPNPKSEWGDY